MCWNLVRSGNCWSEGKHRKDPGTPPTPTPHANFLAFPPPPSPPPLPGLNASLSHGCKAEVPPPQTRTAASSQAPSLYLSKPRACLIMINCHMDNQIQFQKVANDIPRTPGKTRNPSLFPGRKGRSSLSPVTFSCFNNSKQN